MPKNKNHSFNYILCHSILLSLVAIFLVPLSGCSQLKDEGMSDQEYVKINTRMGIEAARRKISGEGELADLQKEICSKYGYSSDALDRKQWKYFIGGSWEDAQKGITMLSNLSKDLDNAPKTDQEWEKYFADEFRIEKKGWKVCGDIRWQRKRLSDPSSDPGWIRISLNNVRIIDEQNSTAEGYVTFENTKAVFFELTASNLYPPTGSVELAPPIPQGFLLYPRETKQYVTPIRFHLDCNNEGVSSVSNLQFKFSRGEYKQCTAQELFNKAVGQGNAGILLQPFTNYGLVVDYTNQAVFMTTLNIYWTAITGSWITRDMIENDLVALGTVLKACKECAIIIQPFGSLTGDILRTLYTKKIEPQLFIKILFEAIQTGLNNPVYADIVYAAVTKLPLGEIAKGGPAILAQNLGIIISGGWRAASLAPITLDVWETKNVEDIISMEFVARCCVSQEQ